jgi:hypothetical protein
LGVTGNPLAVMRPAPACPGKLLRISDQGAEIVYPQVNGACEKATDELDILVPDFTRGLYLERIPVKTVVDQPAASPPTDAAGDRGLRKRVVSFSKLTSDQLGQLRSFISLYAG